MPKPNYAFAKRQRELAKKQKKEAKQREKEAGKTAAEPGTEETPETDAPPATPPAA
jgi:hypothetical protein